MKAGLGLRYGGQAVRTSSVLSSVALATALLSCVAGLILFAVAISALPGANDSPAEAKELGGVALRLNLAEWVAHEHQPDPGFAMPPAMMPGTPAEGLERLHLEVFLQNRTDAAQGFSSREFQLGSDEGYTWEPLNAGEGGLLGPRQALGLDLFFDVPESGRDFHLVWHRGGRQIIVPVQKAGQGPAHEHG